MYLDRYHSRKSNCQCALGTKRIQHTKKGIHHTKKEQNTQKKVF
jgi:hypothetical protein